MQGGGESEVGVRVRAKALNRSAAGRSGRGVESGRRPEKRRRQALRQLAHGADPIYEPGTLNGLRRRSPFRSLTNSPPSEHDHYPECTRSARHLYPR